MYSTPLCCLWSRLLPPKSNRNQPFCLIEMRLYFPLAMIPCKFWEHRVIDQVITSFGISLYICCPFPPFYLAMNTDRTQPDGEICLDGPAQNLTPSPPGHAVGYVKILGGRYTLQVCRFSELSISTNANCGIDTIVLQKSKNGCQDSKFQGCALEGVLEFMSKKLL